MDILDYFGAKIIKKEKENIVFSEKYKPKQSNEILENMKQISICKNWLSESPKKKKGLIITGPPGSCKTTLATLICNECNYRPVIFDASKKRSKKELGIAYDKMMFSKTKVLIMDELDSISNGEHIGISNLVKWVDSKSKKKQRTIPIIFIINSVNINKISELNPHCLKVELNHPSSKKIFVKMIDICEKENINVNYDHLKKFISTNKCDMRSILDNLNNMHIISEKDEELDMYQIYHYINSKDNDLDNKLRYFSMEPGTIPIIVQENYIDWDVNQKQYMEICQSMSFADLYHHVKFKGFLSDTNIANDIYCVLSTLKPFEICSNGSSSNKTISSIRFGSIWTKQSTMYQKKKYITSISSKLNFTNIKSIVFFRDILINLLQNDKIKEAKEFLIQHEMSINDIDEIFRSFSCDYSTLLTQLKKKINT